jgi:hypothetical protein
VPPSLPLVPLVVPSITDGCPSFALHHCAPLTATGHPPVLQLSPEDWQVPGDGDPPVELSVIRLVTGCPPPGPDPPQAAADAFVARLVRGGLSLRGYQQVRPREQTTVCVS